LEIKDLRHTSRQILCQRKFSFFLILGVDMDDKECRIRASQGENEVFDEDYNDDDSWIIDDDGQPDEYTEWQDYMGGDDWDHGQFDEGEW